MASVGSPLPKTFMESIAASAVRPDILEVLRSHKPCRLLGLEQLLYWAPPQLAAANAQAILASCAAVDPDTNPQWQPPAVHDPNDPSDVPANLSVVVTHLLSVYDGVIARGDGMSVQDLLPPMAWAFFATDSFTAFAGYAKGSTASLLPIDAVIWKPSISWPTMAACISDFDAAVDEWWPMSGLPSADDTELDSACRAMIFAVTRPIARIAYFITVSLDEAAAFYDRQYARLAALLVAARMVEICASLSHTYANVVDFSKTDAHALLSLAAHLITSHASQVQGTTPDGPEVLRDAYGKVRDTAESARESATRLQTASTQLELLRGNMRSMLGTLENDEARVRVAKRLVLLWVVALCLVAGVGGLLVLQRRTRLLYAHAVVALALSGAAAFVGLASSARSLDP